MYPNQSNNDPNTRNAIRMGLTEFQSDSMDFTMQHCFPFPITLVLFYDRKIYLPTIMDSLASKILDVFLYKFEAKFENNIYRDFTQ